MSPKSRNAEYTVNTKAVPREIFPDGEVRFSLGVRPDGKTRAGHRKEGEATARRKELDKLQLWHAWDILRAIQDGMISVDEVLRRLDVGGRDALPEIRSDIETRKLGAMPTYNERVAAYLASEEMERKRVTTRAGITSTLHHMARYRTEEDRRAEEAEKEAGASVRERSLGTRPFDAITTTEVLGAIKASTDADSTRETRRSILSTFWKWCIEKEAEAARLEKRSPRWTVNVPRLIEAWSSKPRIATLAPKQVLALLVAAEPYQEAYLRAFLQLGLREDELIHTRLHFDLDLRDWRWTIQGRGPDARHTCKKCRAKGWEPKTPRSWRKMRIPATTTTAPAQEKDGEPIDLIARLAAMAESDDLTMLRDDIRALAAKRPARVANPLRAALTRYLELYPAEPGDFVFRNPRTGHPWTAGRLDVDFRRLCQRAGVPYGTKVPGGVTIHSLRDTCATELVRRGVRESVIAKLLGDTVETVVEWYVHLTEDDVADGVSRGPAYDLASAA